MKHKLIAAAGGLILVSLAAVGTFASQDPVTFQEEETPAATETVEPTATPTDTVEPTATPTEDATATPESTETANDDDADDDGVHGIPDSNPSKQPEDGDGLCEKGETVIKTTPSGTQVNVPCHAADKDDKHEDKAKDKSDKPDDDDADDESDDDESDDDEDEDEDDESEDEEDDDNDEDEDSDE